MKKPKVYIGYVHGGTVAHGFSFSLLRTSTWVGAEYVPVVTPLHSGVVIATHRNKLLNMFLDSGCDYWLSVDTDACWPPEALNKLLAHDVPIVAGHAMGMDYDNDRQFEAILDYDAQGVTKVVLFHSWPDATVQALPEILSHFASPDWELVAL